MEHPSKSGTYILFKCTWNIFQDRTQVRPKTSLRMLKIEITSISLNTVVELMQLGFTKQTGINTHK